MRKAHMIAAALAGPVCAAILDSRKDDFGDGWLNVRNHRFFDDLNALGVTGEPSGQRLTRLGYKVRQLLEEQP